MIRKLIIQISFIFLTFLNSLADYPLPDDIKKMLDPQDQHAVIAYEEIGNDRYYFIKSFDDFSVGYALIATEDQKNKLLSFGEIIWPIDKTKVKLEGYNFFLETLVSREISNYKGGVTELNQVLSQMDGNPYQRYGEDYQNLLRAKGVILK